MAALQEYHYSSSSAFRTDSGGGFLDLSTSGGISQAEPEAEHPFFFQGALTAPKVASRCLSVLAKVVASKFTYTREQRLSLLDPVVTSGGDYVRFEGFSGCCGLFARVDLTPDAYQAVQVHHGTTNVDFNRELRNALSAVGEKSRLSLAIGQEELVLIDGSDQIVEKKVPLPSRWLKGFVEAGTYQANMEEVFRVPRIHAVRFLTSLTKANSLAKEAWLIRQGPGFKFSPSRSSNGVRVGSPERLSFLQELSPFVRGLRISKDSADQVSSWDVDCGSVKFSLTISPETYRGFSGEGQALADLIDDDCLWLSEEIRDNLEWQASIKLSDLARKHKTSTEKIAEALSHLSAQGLVGYDRNLGGYFHREMPFKPERLQTLNPRIKNAQRLVETGVIEWIDPKIRAWIKGDSASYEVKLSETPSCTCRWHTKYLGRRGYCKHILAAQLSAKDKS